MSLLEEARDAPVGGGDVPIGTPFVWTSGPPWVAISPEARDALVELADAAAMICYGNVGQQEHGYNRLAAALERLQR